MIIRTRTMSGNVMACKEYDVFEESDNYYLVFGPDRSTLAVPKDDCEIMSGSSLRVSQNENGRYDITGLTIKELECLSRGQFNMNKWSEDKLKEYELDSVDTSRLFNVIGSACFNHKED